MKTWSHISVSPIAGALGAEVSGVHLGELADGALGEVRDAFIEHQVLFFRDQEITRDQHKAFGRHFGTLQIHPYLQPRTNYRTEHIGGRQAPQVMSAEHPVVRTHPESGRKGLFVNSTFTASIKGMKPAESEALLSFLYRHITTPDFSCRFRWRPNSVAMWDNRCTQHRVVADNRTANRRMERVTINGDKPF
jgi:alpha-ketoglutarate-dependent taurine dioxygenase